VQLLRALQCLQQLLLVGRAVADAPRAMSINLAGDELAERDWPRSRDRPQI
jgi:hypothetical protein